jgi:chromosome partitioning protein
MKNLKTIGVVNQKGGCGKTTTVVNALAYFAKLGHNVILVDADQQKSSSTSARQMNLPFKTSTTAQELVDVIKEVTELYDLILIDGPSSVSEINRTIINRVDLAIIPSKGSGYDLEGARNTIGFLEDSQARCKKPPVGVVYLNDVVENSLVMREARDYFKKAHSSITLLDECVPSRVCISDMAIQGQTIFDMNNRMAKEMAKRYERLFNQAIQIYENTES